MAQFTEITFFIGIIVYINDSIIRARQAYLQLSMASATLTYVLLERLHARAVG